MFFWTPPESTSPLAKPEFPGWGFRAWGHFNPCQPRLFSRSQMSPVPKKILACRQNSYRWGQPPDGPTGRPRSAGPDLGLGLFLGGRGPAQFTWAGERPGPVHLGRPGPAQFTGPLAQFTSALRSSPRSGRSAIPGAICRRNRTPDE